MAGRNERKFIVFLALLPVFALLAAEGAGRVWLWATVGVPGHSYGIYKGDSELGRVLAENSYNRNRQFNNRAFQTPDDVDEGRRGAPRIVVYGGSTSFCYNLDMADTWPRRLQAALRAGAFPRAEVLNAGDIMWSLGHAYRRALREIPDLKPDYVVIYSGINEQDNWRRLRSYHGIDLAAQLAAGKHGAIDNTLLNSNFLIRNSVVGKAFHYYVIARIAPLLRLVTNRPDPHRRAYPPAVLENYQRVLADFIALVRRNGGRAVFVVQAMAVPPGRKAEADAIRLGSSILQTSYRSRDLARKLGAIVIDAQNAVRDYPGDPADLFSKTGVHYSRQGAIRLAAFIQKRAFARRTP